MKYSRRQIFYCRVGGYIAIKMTMIFMTHSYLSMTHTAKCEPQMQADPTLCFSLSDFFYCTKLQVIQVIMLH